MSEWKENQLTVIDENGNETLCQILFTFQFGGWAQTNLFMALW